MSFLAIGLAILLFVVATIVPFSRSVRKWRWSGMLLAFGVVLLFVGLFTIGPDCRAERFANLEATCHSGVELDCRKYRSLAFQCDRLELLENPPRFVQ